MQQIPAAKTIKFEGKNDFKGKFIIEPLFPGYGLTVGNALRRVLLSSITGSAITSVKIAGVDHEFSTMDYVKEDMVDVVLNLKQVNLSIEGPLDPAEQLIIKINKTGQGKVTAKDFECPSQVKIANPDQHIATLTDKAAKLEMECVVNKGMGYLPTENRPGKKLEIGHIAIDAIFTPINHVNVEIEHVRVGEMTNRDKLILTVETNGAITCQDAFQAAVAILVEQFGALSDKAEDQSSKLEQPEQKEIEAEEDSENQAAKSEEIKKEEETVEEKSKKRGRPAHNVNTNITDGPKKDLAPSEEEAE